MSGEENRTPTESTESRTIAVSRTIGAPRDVVFKAFASLEHLSAWWGPQGFSTSTTAFEFRPGGVWEFTLISPDGTTFPEWIQWVEILPFSRIALLHGESEGDPRLFETVLTFEPGGEPSVTLLQMRTVFPTRAMRDEMATRYRAVEAGQQTLEALAAFVEDSQRGAR